MDDPISENQTEITIAKLTNREDGDALLNQAVAAILLSLMKLSAELTTMKAEMSNMKASMWKPNDLENLIDRRHLAACKECPTRKMVELWEAERQHDAHEHMRKKTEPGFWSLLLSKEGLLIIVILLFALMCIYMTAGREGYHDITTTAIPSNGK